MLQTVPDRDDFPTATSPDHGLGLVVVFGLVQPSRPDAALTWADDTVLVSQADSGETDTGEAHAGESAPASAGVPGS